MDEKKIQQLSNYFKDKSTSELSKILRDHNLSEYVKEAFQAIKQILSKREETKVDEYKNENSLLGLHEIISLSDPLRVSEDERKDASNALVRIADPHTLRNLAKDTSLYYHARVEAIRALGKLGYSNSFEDLVLLLNDSNEEVYSAAVDAINKIDPSVMQSLRCQNCKEVVVKSFSQEINICPKCEGAFQQARLTAVQSLPASFNTSIFDLSKESADSLLQTGKMHWKKWYKYLLGYAALGLFLVIVGLFLVLTMGKEMGTLQQSLGSMAGERRLLFEAVYGPQKYMYMIGFFTGMLAVPIGAVGFLFQILRCFLGAPKAGKTYSATLKQFIINSLSSEKSHIMYLKSFVCLLEAARNPISDNYKVYSEYCRKVSDEIKASVIIMQQPKYKLHISSYNVTNITSTAGEGNIILCQVAIKVGSYISITSGKEVKNKNLPDCYLIVSVPVANIGGRWYVCTLDWNGYVVKNPDSPEGVHFSFSGSKGRV